MRIYTTCLAVAVVLAVVSIRTFGVADPKQPATAANVAAPPSKPSPTDHTLNVKFADVQWELFEPDKGPAGSSAIAILHTTPGSHAQQLLIRMPKGSHVPRHWHSADETHTVLKGTFTMDCGEGHQTALSPGSFNYIPARTVHEAWSGPDEDVLLFITVDGPWDLNFLQAPGQAK
jgi:quercetin dioxygenase-like cupin family protein